MKIVSSTALVVRQSREQFAIAAGRSGGSTQTQVTALTAMMMWFLRGQQPTAAHLDDIQYIDMDEKIWKLNPPTKKTQLYHWREYSFVRPNSIKKDCLKAFFIYITPTLPIHIVLCGTEDFSRVTCVCLLRRCVWAKHVVIVCTIGCCGGECIAGGGTVPTWLAFNDTRMEVDADDKLICLEKWILCTRKRKCESLYLSVGLCVFLLCFCVYVWVLVTNILRGYTTTCILHFRSAAKAKTLDPLSVVVQWLVIVVLMITHDAF